MIRRGATLNKGNPLPKRVSISSEYLALRRRRKETDQWDHSEFINAVPPSLCLPAQPKERLARQLVPVTVHHRSVFVFRIFAKMQTKFFNSFKIRSLQKEGRLQCQKYKLKTRAGKRPTSIKRSDKNREGERREENNRSRSMIDDLKESTTTGFIQIHYPPHPSSPIPHQCCLLPQFQLKYSNNYVNPENTLPLI